MNSTVTWKDSMSFEGTAEGHSINLDAKSPLGHSSAITPKEAVAIGLAGCTAMDVIALLKKYKQLPQSFSIKTEITPSEGTYPVVFSSAVLTYTVTGEVEPDKLMEAVTLSQTKYCGVSAMLAKAFPIRYRVELNGTEIGAGQSNFSS